MTNEEETVVEKMWQPLFDLEGKPTLRLGQFLRGLALHLVRTKKKLLPQIATTDFVLQIENYDPKKSLVISPTKMRLFYEETKLEDEIYPWQCKFYKLKFTAQNVATDPEIQ
jgi:hypothetical protein